MTPRKSYVLNEKDLRLINATEGKLRPNYVGIAKELGVSHTAVIKRFNKLVSKDLIKISTLININKIGIKLTLILTEVVSDDYVDELLKRFRECPRIIAMFKVIGEYNLAVLAYAEDESVLNAILGTCMLRTAEGIRRSIVVPITTVLMGNYLKLKIPEKKLKVTPCGLDCSRCRKYLSNECVGCPATIHYRGKLAITEQSTNP